MDRKSLTVSSFLASMFTRIHRYTGTLCLACSKENYVKQGNECTECPGGGVFISAFGPVIVCCGFLYIFVVVYLLRSANKNPQQTIGASKRVKKLNRMFGQGKILLSLVQIIASMPTVLSGVNFPPFFIHVSNVFGIFNLDILSLSTELSTAFGCSMSVRFFDRFIIHLLLPVLCLVAIGLAVVTAEPIRRCCSKQGAKQTNHMNEAVFKIIVLVILLLFPGLSTKLFSVFNCKRFEGIDDKTFLVQDYGIECDQGEHLEYTSIAGFFLALYIAGIPCLMFCLLWCNKKHLHDKASKKHHLVKVALGGLCKCGEMLCCRGVVLFSEEPLPDAVDFFYCVCVLFCLWHRLAVRTKILVV